MARDIIKYITYAPKTESIWNTPEEKKQEKERVIEHASQEMVKSLINRNKKTSKFDYRGIYYNGKLGLIIIGRIPEDAQEESYKDYTTLFDIDLASDPENIKDIIKEYLKENNLGGVIFKLTEEGTKPKGLYDQLHRQLKGGESELFFSGAIDNIASKYDWIKTALDIELEPDDELINGTYTIEYSEAGDEVTGLMHITALSKQGILYTAQGKMVGEKSSEAESFTEKSSNKIKLIPEIKAFQEKLKERVEKIEKTTNIVEEKRLTESISVGGEVLLETYKGELKEGPKIYYGLNVGYNLGHKVIAGVNSNIDTSKHNILRYNGKLYLDKNTHDKTRIGDPLFIERIYQRFIKDIRGINNVYAYNAFQSDERLVFPTVKGLFTEKNIGNSKITPYTWLFVGRGVGEYPDDKEAEFSLGILGKEFSQSEYGFTVTRRILNDQFSAVSVSFTNPDKFKEIVDYYYKRASEFMLGSTKVEYPKTYPSSYLEGDKGLLEPLSLDQYAIHRTNLGTIVGSSGIVEKYLASMSDARGYDKNEEGYMPYDFISTYESTVATAEILKATGSAIDSKPIIGPTPYLCHSSKKNTNNEYGAIALMFGQAHFCNILGGLKDWEVPNSEVRTELGITESTLSAEIVDVIQLNLNGDTAQSDRDKDYTPYIKVVFDISENGKKIARVSSIYTLDIIKHQAVEIASKPVEINP